jgi:hypothetical protein
MADTPNWMTGDQPVSPPDYMSGDTPIDQSYGGGLARAAGQGLFGFGDELEGAYQHFVNGQDYEVARKLAEAKAQKFIQDNPVAGHGAEIGTALATSFIPGLGGARLAQLGSRVMAGQATLRTLAHESGKLGVKMGALQGFGAGEGDLSTPSGAVERLPSAAMGAALGYPLGATAGVVGHGLTSGLAKSANRLGDIAAEGSDPLRGAVRQINRDFARSGTSADQLLNEILPGYGQGAQAMPRDTLINILSGHAEAMAQGLDDAAAQKQVVAALVRGGTKKRTAEAQVREVLRRYNEANQIPMQLHELPALRDGSVGAEPNWSMRVAANRTNDNADAFRSVLRDRQQALPAALADVKSNLLGGRDADEVMEAARRALDRQNDSLYSSARALDEAALGGQRVMHGRQPVSPVNVSEALIGLADRYPEHGGPVAGPMNEAINLFLRPNPMHEAEGVRTLQQFIDQKRQLDQMIATSIKDGRPTPLTRELQQFKQALMDVVGRQNPAYAEANRLAAKGFSEMRAGEMAKQLGLGMNFKSRQILRQFRSMTPEQQDMVRVQHAQMLQDKLDNVFRGGATNPGKMLDTMGSEKILRALYGDEAADGMMRAIKRVAIATRSHGQLAGQSQTTPLSQAAKERDSGEVIRQMLSMIGSPSQMMGKVAEHAAGQVNSKRDAEVLRMLGVSTENPHELIAVLQQLREAAARQQAAGQGATGRLAPYAAPAFVAAEETTRQ